ncbi:MAG: polysaccharide deacetylase family protein [Candidatus Micrarchaeia archaeon]|jgi:peptidoglycan/xylan/chitin deacetylase (PgdA/CDA1 family)
MQSLICARVDLDSASCINGIPFFLDFFKERKIKASFFSVMGPETGLSEATGALAKSISRKFSSQKSATLGKASHPQGPPGSRIRGLLREHGVLETLRFTFLPKNSIAEYGESHLKEVLKAGHCLGTHGWKHSTWGKDEAKTTLEFGFAIAKFKELFKRKPKIHTSPMCRWNPTLLGLLDQEGFVCSSDFDNFQTPFPFHPRIGKKVFTHLQIPFSHPLAWNVSEREITANPEKIAGLAQEGGVLMVPTHGKAFNNAAEVSLISQTIELALDAGAKPATFEQAAAIWNRKAKAVDATKYLSR